MDVMSADPPTSSTDVSVGVPGSNPPNLDGILLLEAPFARVPFDELRRQQKTQQRLVERELLFASTAFSDAAKSLSAASSSPSADVHKCLDAVLGRLKGLKRKLTSISDAANTSLCMAHSRTHHLQLVHNMSDSDSPEFREWSKTRLDRMIVDYMLRRGYPSAAHELAHTRRITHLVDLQLFEHMASIEDSLCPPAWAKPPRAGARVPSCSLALAWCSENKATLRKIRTPLEFNLRLQEFVELTRTRTTQSIKDAIAYARRHLLPLVTTSAASSSSAAASKPNATNTNNTTTTSTTVAPTGATAADKEAEYDRLANQAIRREVSRAMGLLACGPDSWPYADLYSLNRWSMLRDSFRACALQIHSLPPQPILHIALSAGLSSLKLPQCYSATGAHARGDPIQHQTECGTTAARGPNVDCPICDTEGLGRLANEVPWSHHQNSTLVCSHSGTIMDENDPPLALGNGRVYAQSTVLELVKAAQADHHHVGIVCPRTQEVCRVDDVRKVYIS